MDRLHLTIGRCDDDANVRRISPAGAPSYSGALQATNAELPRVGPTAEVYTHYTLERAVVSFAHILSF